MQFNSLWLQFYRPQWPSLKNDTQADIAIIGAGISGITTLYFLLTHTNKKIVLLEKNRVASGASGHNAGLASAVIEKPIKELIDTFGLEKTQQAYAEIDHGWELLVSSIQTTNAIDNFIPILDVKLGLTSLEVILHSLTQEVLQDQLGRGCWRYLVLDHADIKNNIPEKFHKYIEFVSPQQIQTTLNTIDSGYIAVAIRANPIKAARVNSAKLCHQLLAYLQQKFPDRLAIYENTEISQIDLYAEKNVLHFANGLISANDVILCTNGYTHFKIIDHATQKSVTKLYEAITAREGYMGAYLNKNPGSYVQAFFDDRHIYKNVPYFYLSQIDGTLIVGGPEYDLPKKYTDDHIEQQANESLAVDQQLLQQAFGITLDAFDYFWHGIMGYTTSGLRWVGKNAEHPHLWYNLGCNGVGIVSAFSSAEKIARLMQGETLPSSLFDPP